MDAAFVNPTPGTTRFLLMAKRPGRANALGTLTLYANGYEDARAKGQAIAEHIYGAPVAVLLARRQP